MIQKFNKDYESLTGAELEKIGFTRVWTGSAQESFKEWKRWAVLVSEGNDDVLIQIRELEGSGLGLWVSNSLIDWYRVHESGEIHPIIQENIRAPWHPSSFCG